MSAIQSISTGTLVDEKRENDQMMHLHFFKDGEILNMAQITLKDAKCLQERQKKHVKR